MPWQVVTSPDGKTVYVANPDSNSISVISAATRTVTSTVTVAGDPDTLALTPDGQQLWVGTSHGSQGDRAQHGGQLPRRGDRPGRAPNAADGYAPTGIALTATPTAGS